MAISVWRSSRQRQRAVDTTATRVTLSSNPFRPVIDELFTGLHRANSVEAGVDQSLPKHVE